MIPRVFLFLALFASCVTVGYSYQIDSLEISEIDSRLNIDVDYLNDDQVDLSIQIFPQKKDFVNQYKLVFDMKFRKIMIQSLMEFVLVLIGMILAQVNLL